MLPAPLVGYLTVMAMVGSAYALFTYDQYGIWGFKPSMLIVLVLLISLDAIPDFITEKARLRRRRRNLAQDRKLGMEMRLRDRQRRSGLPVPSTGPSGRPISVWSSWEA